ncbi:MAG TPA: hypothetical protein VEB03_00735 [Candidatus Nanoarchaeia archaeon]|nr:hypothetical protein [Candidatus Nanoarchaeia archaeon]
MGVLSIETARTRGADYGVKTLAVSVPMPPAALLNLDLSFLEIDVPGPVGDARETAIRPSHVSGNTGLDESTAEEACQLLNKPAVAQRLQVAFDSQDGEYSMAVANALIDVLEQAADLFPRERKTVAEHLGRCLVSTRSRECSDVVSGVDIDLVLKDCKPRRAAALDGPATLNFYLSWLLTAIDRLAPAREIRERVSRIVQAHDFVRQGRSILFDRNASDSGVRT